MSKLLDELRSEEGQRLAKEFFDKRNKEIEILESQLERFHQRFSHRFEELVDKVVTKYDSDVYKDRWFNRGIEPPQDLLWFLFKYSKKYGRVVSDKETEHHGNVFVSEMYAIGLFYFMRMDGQGSCINVIKI